MAVEKDHKEKAAGMIINPNPFNPSTNITYSLDKPARVSLSLFNAKGECVANLVNGTEAPGTHTATFDANRFPSGMYVGKLTFGKTSYTKQLLLVK